MNLAPSSPLRGSLPILSGSRFINRNGFFKGQKTYDFGRQFCQIYWKIFTFLYHFQKNADYNRLQKFLYLSDFNNFCFFGTASIQFVHFWGFRDPVTRWGHPFVTKTISGRIDARSRTLKKNHS